MNSEFSEEFLLKKEIEDSLSPPPINQDDMDLFDCSEATNDSSLFLGPFIDIKTEPEEYEYDEGDMKYSCEINKALNDKDLLECKMEVDTEERNSQSEAKPFGCKLCGKTFSRNYKLTVHMRIHNGEKPYRCGECKKAFSEKGNLTKHMKVHTGEKPFTCAECGRTFSQKSHLSGHMLTHTGEKPFPCTVCGTRAFALKRHLKNHMWKCIGVKSARGSISQNPSSVELRRALRRVKRYTCVECGKKFSRKPILRAHMRIHTGEKPFTCSECGKAFSLKNTLTNHMSTHTGEKPFICRECGKAFTRKSGLTSHGKIHKVGMSFACRECGKTFSLECDLTIHMKVHA